MVATHGVRVDRGKQRAHKHWAEGRLSRLGAILFVQTERLGTVTLVVVIGTESAFRFD